MDGSTMFKWLLATVAGAAITAGAVYVGQHPEVLEPKPRVETPVSAEDISVDAAKATDTPMGTEGSSKGVIDRLIGKPVEAAKTPPKPVVITPAKPVEIEAVLVDDMQDEIVDVEPQAREQVVLMQEGVAVKDMSLTTVDLPQKTNAMHTDHDHDGEHVADDKAAAMSLIDQILIQAEQIENPDLRDQAYLDLVDFSLSQGNFDAAKDAMTKLQQIELRDNARGRIAEGYARAGQRDAAFAMIDNVEIEDFRDFQRLRVIQALIVEPKGR